MDYELFLDISEENYLHLYVPKIATINIFDGNIISRAMKNPSAMFSLTSRPFIAINVLGRKNSALWPEAASKAEAVK